MNEYLWDNVEDRIPKEDYRKLKGWIKEKERLRAEPEKEKQPEQGQEIAAKQRKEDPNKIEYQGESYKKQDPASKLNDLVLKTRESEEKLPFEDYQKLRTWVEDADRARWSGALEKQLALTHEKFERSKTMEELKAAEGGRVLEPAMEEMMRNPIVGLFLKVASISNEIVRSIPLDDRLRDPLKEGRDDLEAGKKGIDQREQERMATPKSGMTPEQLQSLNISEKKDRNNREKIERDIEGNKKAKDRELKQQKEERNKDKTDDWDRFDPWGMY